MDQPPPTLRKRRLVTAPGLTVDDVRCSSCRSSWTPPEEAPSHGVVFVRRGCFRRRGAGREVLADAAAVYFERPGEAYEVAHPHDGGDACTHVVIADELLASLAGGEPSLPRRPLFTSPQVDLEHRRLIAAAARGEDEFELAERVVALVAAGLEMDNPTRAQARRPPTALSRRRAVDDVRAALCARPAAELLELARAVAVSPHHLSRIFRDETGATLSRYRNRLRVRVALERLSEGEERLTRLAAELGFADHAHLTRVVRDEVGSTPSALRAALTRQACASASH